MRVDVTIVTVGSKTVRVDVTIVTVGSKTVRVDATILTVCSEIASAGTTISIVFGADMVEIEKKECDTDEVLEVCCRSGVVRQWCKGCCKGSTHTPQPEITDQ